MNGLLKYHYPELFYNRQKDIFDLDHEEKP